MNMLKKLFKSGYEGVISEVGLGVPLQAYVLSEPGASEFLLMGLTPYNQAFQPRLAGRSVSERMATKMAEIAFNQAKSHSFPRSGKKLFSAAITGTHVRGVEGAQTHAWMCVMTDEVFIVHFVTPPSSRKQAIKMMGWASLRILEAALLKINPIMPTYGPSIDVIRWPNMTMLDKVKLLEYSATPIYFDQAGDMQRPADIIRAAKSIYRGSFNPPTNAHMKIGGDALFEISLQNMRKDNIQYEDLVHRISMLNALGKGVLVTSYCPRFTELARELQGYGVDPNVEYVMGADTFNRVCSDTHNDFKQDIQRLRMMNIVVSNRDSLPLDIFANSNAKVKIINPNDNFSSTLARQGDHSGIDKVTSDYIKQNKLY